MSPKPGKRADAALEVDAVSRLLSTHLRRVPAVLGGDHRAQLLHALGHVPGEAVHGRPLAEGRVEHSRIHGRDARRVEVAEPLLQLERSREGGLHRHLLVEREADQQRQRVSRQQRVRLWIAGEVERGRRGRHEADTSPSPSSTRLPGTMSSRPSGQRTQALWPPS